MGLAGLLYTTGNFSDNTPLFLSHRLTIEHNIKSLKRVIRPPSHTQTATKDDGATYPTPSPATATNVPFTDDTLHDRRSITTPDAP